HVPAVIRFDDDRRAASKTFSHESGDVSKVHHRSNLYSLMCGRKPKIVYGVVRNCKRMKVDLTDAEVATGLNLFDAVTQGLGAPSRFFIVNVKPLADVRIKRLR